MCVWNVLVYGFTIYAVFHFFASSLFFSPRVSLPLLFHYAVFFSPPALAHRLRSLILSCLISFFFLPSYLFLRCMWYSYLYFSLSSFSQYFEPLFVFSSFLHIFASYILVFTCLTPRANSEGGGSSLWRKSHLSAALYQISPTNQNPFHSKPVDIIKNSYSYPSYMFSDLVSLFIIDQIIMFCPSPSSASRILVVIHILDTEYKIMNRNI